MLYTWTTAERIEFVDCIKTFETQIDSSIVYSKRDFHLYTIILKTKIGRRPIQTRIFSPIAEHSRKICQRLNIFFCLISKNMFCLMNRVAFRSMSKFIDVVDNSGNLWGSRPWIVSCIC